VRVQAALNTADVLYYHSQQVKGPPERKAFPEQLRLVVGVGSAVLHKELDDPSFMCQVSIILMACADDRMALCSCGCCRLLTMRV
jgi:hypothetical protein